MPATIVMRAVFAALVALSLVAAIVGGLWRTGMHLPDAAVVARSAGQHAALMLSVLLGTTISLERAVALGRRWAYAAPVLAAVSGLLIVCGLRPEAAALGVVAAVVFVAVNVFLLHRAQDSATAMMVLGALCWLAGNALEALEPGQPAVIAWWFAFPVLTITAERLELTRFLPRRSSAGTLLRTIAAGIVAAAATSVIDPAMGGVAFGAALVLLALWLAAFDIARRTVFAGGVARFMAAALLTGYLWLAVGGLAWLGTALGCPGRDVALHALGLGFIFSMVIGHAPVIVPALAGVRLRFGAWFYAPLLLLHASLACRLFGAIAHPEWRTLGAQVNAAAIGLFVATVAGSALAWRRRDVRRDRGRAHAPRARPT